MSIDAAEWLKALGLEQYAPAFVSNDVDAEVLPELTSDDLIGIGVSSIGRRDHPLAGRVESFAPGSGAEFCLLPSDNATGNFTKIVQRVPVRIRLPRTGPLARLLRPGLSVTVTAHTREKGEAAAADGIVGAIEARPTPGKPASAR